MNSITIALLVLANQPSAGALTPRTETASSIVSVRLRPLKESISVTGTDLTVSSNGKVLTRTRGFSRLLFRFRKGNGREYWQYSSPSEISTSALVQQTTDFGRKIEIFGDGLRVDLRPAPASVQLVARKNQRGRKDSWNVDLVGYLNLEDYLVGVLAGEVPKDWPMEALKAQAVAARSFAVARMNERRSLQPDWLLESDVTDQVFDFERIHSRAVQAVRSTINEVLTDPTSDRPMRVVAANYHSDCGGATDEPSTIWGGRTIKQGTAKDPNCGLQKRSSWRFVSTLEELVARLAKQNLLPAHFQLASLSIVGRSPAGRALELEARDGAGQSKRFSGERMRSALGFSEVKSALFDVKVTDTQLELVGRGFGHGSGLCQWGARARAESGQTYREILHHYYPKLGAKSWLTGVSPSANASP